jgi:hypothetical protein
MYYRTVMMVAHAILRKSKVTAILILQDVHTCEQYA